MSNILAQIQAIREDADKHIAKHRSYRQETDAQKELVNERIDASMAVAFHQICDVLDAAEKISHGDRDFPHQHWDVVCRSLYDIHCNAAAAEDCKWWQFNKRLGHIKQCFTHLGEIGRWGSRIPTWLKVNCSIHVSDLDYWIKTNGKGGAHKEKQQ